jgi:hypothetical protein
MGQVPKNPHHSDIGPGEVDRLLPEYQLYSPSKELLKAKLHEFYQLCAPPEDEEDEEDEEEPPVVPTKPNRKKKGAAA